MVGKNEEHAGCKCRKGYEGDFCQFVYGSKPSDWTLDNYMHPALTMYEATDNGNGRLIGILVGAGVGFIVIASILVMYLYCGFQDLKAKLRRSEKEMDTGATFQGEGGNTSAPASSPTNADFIGGKSVYKKKSTTGHFVTADTLEADGGVLTDALEGKAETMEDVSLDDLPSALPNNGSGGSGELA